MDTVLLTGATGFLGSHLLRGLLNKTDCNIVILKRSFSNIDRIVEFTDVKRIKSYDIDCVDLEKRKMKVYLLPHFRSKRLNFLFHPIKIQPDKKSYFPKHDSDPDD